MKWIVSAAFAIVPATLLAQQNNVHAATTTDNNTITVQSGDTLSQLAETHNTTVSQLVNANSIKDANFILTGQKLQLASAAASAASSAATTNVTSYTVQSGDTLSAIAAKFNVTLTNLISYNNISNPNLITVGQQLSLVPTATSAASSAASSAATSAAPSSAASSVASSAAPASSAATTATSTAASSAAATTTTTTSTTTTNSSSTTTTTSGSARTMKLSFYDPAVLGSDLGYGGVAANLSVYPKGTQLKITLSNGTVWYRAVNDTGSFAYSNPNQLDVAMPSSQIPSAGILTATVEVVG
ncbi:LysM peptidoglycan-binding domain-containing protein [Lacticaseibacillus pantheris]|uniref:LysM peptidoglycan-binding domain-containing protein n=1 Tax=Lacticaseibacillus pantheris TaxID=171523 RepID=UPI003451F113